jgi:hypothetical protein
VAKWHLHHALILHGQAHPTSRLPHAPAKANRATGAKAAAQASTKVREHLQGKIIFIPGNLLKIVAG